MALDITRLEDDIMDKMENAYGLVALAGYDAAELRKFANLMATAFVNEMHNAELSGAVLDSAAVSGTTDTTISSTNTPLDNGAVDTLTVSGGIT